MWTDGSCCLDYCSSGIGIYFDDPRLHDLNVSEALVVPEDDSTRAELMAIAVGLEALLLNVFRYTGWKRRSSQVTLSNQF